MDVPTHVNVSAKRTSAREVFLHLLFIITLYVSAASFVTLLFQYVNILIPDPLFLDHGNYLSYRGPLRFAVASLLVVFPVFMVVSWFLNRSYLRDAALREMRLRKWLVYFTLFAAALIMIGDLVALVYQLLGGEFTTRFILKAFALLATVGAIFWYELADVRREGPLPSMKRFVWGVSAVVGVAVIGAFFLVGSPASERARRFDDERVNHLQEIQGRVVEFWRSKEQLPENLDALTDDIAGFRAPVDPETGMPYEYRPLPVNAGTGPAFELCATFRLPSVAASKARSVVPYPDDSRPVEETWEHGAGRTCFTRTIDPETYPPYEKPARPAR